MNADIVNQWSFMDAEGLECLVSLLNDALLNEVVEERVLRGLCCNMLLSCPNP